MKLILSITGGFFLSLFLISCEKSEGGEKENTPAASAALPVEYMIARPTHFSSQVTSTAEVLPFESVTLRAPVQGTVLSIQFEEGSHIREGQVLVRLDDRAWKAQLEGLKAELLSTKKELDRNKRLLEVEGASQQAVDQGVADIASTQAEIEQLQVNIQLANVRAPFSGKVGMRNFSLGSYLNQGEEITTLAQVDKLKVNFNLPERYRPDIKEGDQVNVIIAEDTIQASIYAIDPMIDPQTRTVQARGVMEAADEKYIMPGAFAEVILPTKVSENAILLPTQAIVPEIEAQTVYVAKGNKAIRKEVTLGSRNNEQVHILQGVQPGDTVITTGLLQVKNGTPVQLKSSQAE